MKLIPGILAIAFAAWVGVQAAQTIQPLTPGDKVVARYLLENYYDTPGEVVSGQIVQAGGKVYLQANVRVAPGNVQEVILEIGDANQRPYVGGK